MGYLIFAVLTYTHICVQGTIDWLFTWNYRHQIVAKAIYALLIPTDGLESSNVQFSILGTMWYKKDSKLAIGH